MHGYNESAAGTVRGFTSWAELSWAVCEQRGSEANGAQIWAGTFTVVITLLQQGPDDNHPSSLYV